MGFQSESVKEINSQFKGDGVFHRKVVALTNAQIKAMRGTPVVLLAAPGVGWWYEIEDVVLILNAGTNVLSESAANLQVRYGSSGSVYPLAVIEMTGFIDQAVDQMSINFAQAIVTTPASGVVNKDVEIYNTGAGEFAGNAALDATMTIIVNYQIHKSYL
jgi:hypothetical protein